MTKLAYSETRLREDDLVQHERVFHNSDGTVIKARRSAFQERVVRSIAECILMNWDKFIKIKKDENSISAFIEIKEIEL